jgi:hypothetical protein
MGGRFTSASTSVASIIVPALISKPRRSSCRFKASKIVFARPASARLT